jgi:hypothetical protein
MNRRGFLGFLGLTGAVALVQPKIFLPPPCGWNRTMSDYLTSKHAWFLKTEHKDGVSLFNRSHPLSSPEFAKTLRPRIEEFWNQEYDKHADEWANLYLSEASLEKVMVDIKEEAGDRRIALIPRFLVRRA